MSLANDIAMRLRNRHKIDSEAALNSIAELLGDSIEAVFLLPVHELVGAYENHVKHEEESLRARGVQLEAQQFAEEADEYKNPIFEHLNTVAKADESAKAVLENEFPSTFDDMIKQSNEEWIKAVLKRFGELIRADRRLAGFPNPKGLSKAKFCSKLMSLGHSLDVYTLTKIENGEAVRTKQFLNAMRLNLETLAKFIGIFKLFLFLSLDDFISCDQEGSLVVPKNEEILAQLSKLCIGTGRDMCLSRRSAYLYKSGQCNPSADFWLRLWANGIEQYTAAIPAWQNVATRRDLLNDAIPVRPLDHEEYLAKRAEGQRQWQFESWLTHNFDHWLKHGYDDRLMNWSNDFDPAREFFSSALPTEMAKRFEAALAVQFSVMQ